MTQKDFPLLDDFTIPEGGVCGAFATEVAEEEDEQQQLADAVTMPEAADEEATGEDFDLFEQTEGPEDIMAPEEAVAMKVAIEIENIAETPTEILLDALRLIDNRHHGDEPTIQMEGEREKILTELRERGVDYTKEGRKKVALTREQAESLLSGSYGLSPQEVQGFLSSLPSPIEELSSTDLMDMLESSLGDDEVFASRVLGAKKTAQFPDLMAEYKQWVKDEGHITASASSVLREFIETKGYSQKEYEDLASQLGFTDFRHFASRKHVANRKKTADYRTGIQIIEAVVTGPLQGEPTSQLWGDIFDILSDAALEIENENSEMAQELRAIVYESGEPEANEWRRLLTTLLSKHSSLKKRAEYNTGIKIIENVITGPLQQTLDDDGWENVSDMLGDAWVELQDDSFGISQELNTMLERGWEDEGEARRALTTLLSKYSAKTAATIVYWDGTREEAPEDIGQAKAQMERGLDGWMEPTDFIDWNEQVSTIDPNAIIEGRVMTEFSEPTDAAAVLLKKTAQGDALEDAQGLVPEQRAQSVEVEEMKGTKDIPLPVETVEEDNFVVDAVTRKLVPFVDKKRAQLVQIEQIRDALLQAGYAPSQLHNECLRKGYKQVAKEIAEFLGVSGEEIDEQAALVLAIKEIALDESGTYPDEEVAGSDLADRIESGEFAPQEEGPANVEELGEEMAPDEAAPGGAPPESPVSPEELVMKGEEPVYQEGEDLPGDDEMEEKERQVVEQVEEAPESEEDEELFEELDEEEAKKRGGRSLKTAKYRISEDMIDTIGGDLGMDAEITLEELAQQGNFEEHNINTLKEVIKWLEIEQQHDSGAVELVTDMKQFLNDNPGLANM